MEKAKSKNIKRIAFSFISGGIFSNGHRDLAALGMLQGLVDVSTFKEVLIIVPKDDEFQVFVEAYKKLHHGAMPEWA